MISFLFCFLTSLFIFLSLPSPPPPQKKKDNGYGAAKKWGEEQKKIDKILNSSAFDRNYSKTKSTFSQLVRDWGDEVFVFIIYFIIYYYYYY